MKPLIGVGMKSIQRGVEFLLSLPVLPHHWNNCAKVAGVSQARLHYAVIVPRAARTRCRFAALLLFPHRSKVGRWVVG
jgi:hypothetical protein